LGRVKSGNKNALRRGPKNFLLGDEERKPRSIKKKESFREGGGSEVKERPSKKRRAGHLASRKTETQRVVLGRRVEYSLRRGVRDRRARRSG